MPNDCVGRIIGYHPDHGELWVQEHEWRQRWSSYQELRHTDGGNAFNVQVTYPDGFYCVHCLRVNT